MDLTKEAAKENHQEEATENQLGCGQFWTKNNFIHSGPATQQTQDQTPSWKNNLWKWLVFRPESSESGSKTRGARIKKRPFWWSSRCNKKRLVLAKKGFQFFVAFNFRLSIFPSYFLLEFLCWFFSWIFSCIFSSNIFLKLFPLLIFPWWMFLKQIFFKSPKSAPFQLWWDYTDHSTRTKY